MSNFSFSHSVFKRLASQGCQKMSLCGNGLNSLFTVHGSLIWFLTDLFSFVLVDEENGICNIPDKTDCDSLSTDCRTEEGNFHCECKQGFEVIPSKKDRCKGLYVTTDRKQINQ